MIAMLVRWLPGLPILAALLALFPAAPARAQYDPPKQVTLSPSGVDFTKGHFHHEAVDLSIGPFELERSYASGGPRWGSNHFGGRWTHNYSIFVYEKDRSKLDGIYVVIGRDVVQFNSSTLNTFNCWVPSCDGASLKVVGSAFVYTDVHGNVYTFNPAVNAFPPWTNIQPPLRNQRIASIEYADGHTLSFSYTGSLLTQISSNYGYSLVFENSALGYITKACVYNRAVIAAGSNCSAAPSSVTYQYGPNGDNLVNVVDLMGQSRGYAYSSPTTSANMTCVRQVNSSSCRIANAYSAALGSVTVQQTTADGAVWTTTVNRADPDDPQLPGEPPPYSDATFDGPEGIGAVAVLGGGLLNTYHENGRTTHLTWNGIELEKLTHHEGNSVTYGRLGPIVLGETWTPKPGSGLSPVSWSMSLGFQQGVSCATFPKTCHKPVWRKDYKDNQTDYTHDPVHGGVLTETGPEANGVRPQKRYAYVERAAVTAAGAPAGRTIWLLDRMAFCRSGNSNASKTGCALGAGDEVVTTYDYGPTSGPNNLQLRGQAVTADGTTLRTCYGYDSLGRKISETSPMGTAGLTACPAGPPTAAAPFTTSTRYDSMGRVTGTIAPDPDGAGPLAFAAVRTSYDAGGRLTRVEKGQLAGWQSEAVAPADWTGFTIFTQVDTAYDSMDRKVREAVSGSGVTSGVTEYGYDLAGRLKCTAVRMNPDVWASALPDKCVAGTPHPVDGPDRITRNHYDPLGQITRIERAVGTPLQQVYASYTYSPNGRRTSVTDANGNRAEMSWDGLDRQKRWIFPSKTAPGETNPADYEEYGYDANASRTSLRKRDGVTLVYAYDALNRMSQKTVPASATGAAGYSVFYGYDLRGLQTFARFGSASGPGVTNVYDGFGRLASSTTSMDGVSRALASQYDADGNRTIVSGDQNYFMWFGYDGLGRMSTLGNLVRFGYDSAGRRSSLNMGPGGPTSSAGYAYDPAGRLQTLSHDLAGTGWDRTLGFTYNPASQIASRSSSNDGYASNTAYNVVRPYGVNGLNQYTAAGPANFGYDANGNLTSDGSTNFVYDAENRLVSASGAKSASLAYDPLGRLWQVAAPSGTTRFLYDGDRLAMEYGGAGNVLRSYVHGPGADEPLVWFEGALGWAHRYLHADHQGSIAAIADAGGNPVAINAYDPWGIPNADNQGRFGYTGQTWIPELGLWYYKARFYSPTTGRFLQVDPVGYKDQMNLYAYVGNDPVNHTDPTGLYVCRGKDCDEVHQYVRSLRESMKGLKVASAEYQRLARISGTLGIAGHRNGITIRTGEISGTALGNSNGRGLIRIDVGKIEQRAAISIANLNSGMNFLNVARGYGATVLGHEVDHEIDSGGRGEPNSRAVEFQRETLGFNTSVSIAKGLGLTTELWSPYLSQSQIDANVAAAAQRSTDAWCRDSGKC